jgi:hypothetical protein
MPASCARSEPVRDLVCDDQVVVRVDRRLHVIANDAAPLGGSGHRTCVRIGERDLPIGRRLEPLTNFLQLGHPLA